MSEPIPEKIIFHFNRGDSDAYGFLYRALYPEVDWLSRRFIRQSDVSADITSKAFLQMWQYHGRFSNLRDIKSFLYTTVKNACLDHLRHQQVVRKNQDALQEYLGVQDNPAEELEKTQEELFELVRRAMDQLPKKCRRICQLAFLHNMEVEDIARKLGISEKTVYNQKIMGIQRLRIRLNPGDP